MHILLLSRDASALDPQSRTAQRWHLLAQQGLRITAFVLSREQTKWKKDQVEVIGSGGGSVSRFWRLWRCARRSKESFDMISAQDPFELGLIGYFIARRLNIPLEIQDHGGCFGETMRYEPLWFIRGRLAFWLARLAQAIRTVNPKSFAALQSMKLKAKTYFLPIATEARFFEAHHQPVSNLIVSIARLVSVKQLELLIRAFALIHARRPEARLCILGTGPLLESLKQLTRSLGVQEAVEFKGQTDPMEILESATVFVLPSAHEGWCLAAVEAAVVGVPVVMTDTGAARWLQERQAVHIVDADVEALALGIELALKQPEAFKRVVDAPRLDEVVREQRQAWQDIAKHH